MKVLSSMMSGVVFAAMLVSGAGLAHAQTGDEILRKVEETMTAARDRQAEVEMTLTERDGTVKTRKMKLLNKGQDKRLFTFLAPADVKGVSFLVLDDDKTYLYTPAFGKIRRIASSAKGENFMGTDFSYNDLSRSKYPEKYSAKEIKDGGSTWLLECTPRPGSGTDYSKLEMTVDKKSYMPTDIRLFDKAGRLWKHLVNHKIEKIDGYWCTRKITMDDVLKNHKTVMALKEIAHDVGLSDSAFSKRILKKFH